MKVEFKTTIKHNGKLYLPGTVEDFDETTGSMFVEKGFAVVPDLPKKSEPKQEPTSKAKTEPEKKQKTKVSKKKYKR